MYTQHLLGNGIHHNLYISKDSVLSTQYGQQGSKRDAQKDKVCCASMSTWEEEEVPPQERIIVTVLKSKLQVTRVYEVIMGMNA
jgi:hypothetical protein